MQNFGQTTRMWTSHSAKWKLTWNSTKDKEQLISQRPALTIYLAMVRNTEVALDKLNHYLFVLSAVATPELI
jgi:hypothetical protein